MTIDARCLVCKNPDRRRIVELGWNGGMSADAIARTLDIKGLASATITRHIKEHSDGDGNTRAVEVEPELPASERVANLQRLQLDEVERRIALARAKADLMNAEREGVNDAEGKPLPLVDWSEFFDILGKDGQSAIGSILKAQGLKDKREAKSNDLKLGLFEAMSRAGLSPKGKAPVALTAGDEDADDA